MDHLYSYFIILVSTAEQSFYKCSRANFLIFFPPTCKDFSLLCIKNITTTFSVPTKTGVLSMLTPSRQPDNRR